jgi:uncharacterized protein YqhQ
MNKDDTPIIVKVQEEEEYEQLIERENKAKYGTLFYTCFYLLIVLAVAFIIYLFVTVVK